MDPKIDSRHIALYIIHIICVILRNIMANVTLSINDDLLKKSRLYAADHHLSLNALIRQLLRRTVESDSEQWLEECFHLMDQSEANSNGRKWNRDEVYEQ